MQTLSMSEFIEFVKKEYGKEISIIKEKDSDTFEKLFGGSFLFEEDDPVHTSSEELEYDCSAMSASFNIPLTYTFKISEYSILGYAA